MGRIVRIHCESFQGFFLTVLGTKFLSCLYEEIQRDSTGILICHRDGERVVGFVAGTTMPVSFYRRLLVRRWWRFAWAAVMPTVRRPWIIPRLVNAFRRPGEAATHGVECAELMSVAVDPGMQGLGVGRQLVQEFLRESRQRGSREVVLTTDALGNEPVRAFYEQLGFRLRKMFRTAQGREMCLYGIRVD